MTKCQQVGECMFPEHNLLNSLHTILNLCKDFYIIVRGKRSLLKERGQGNPAENHKHAYSRVVVNDRLLGKASLQPSEHKAKLLPLRCLIQSSTFWYYGGSFVTHGKCSYVSFAVLSRCPSSNYPINTIPRSYFVLIITGGPQCHGS